MVFCNPLNLDYKFQHLALVQEKNPIVYREAADASFVFFREKYYCFPSMSLGFYVSENLSDWTWHGLPQELPLYDYAPDARVIGDWLYLCASKNDGICDFYRTMDPESGIFERIPGTFPFWDPNLFLDDDGRLYLYWGCSSTEPVYGVELDRASMKPLGKKQALFAANESQYGFERPGEDHKLPFTPEEIEFRFQGLLYYKKIDAALLSEEQIAKLKRGVGNAPYIEGAWMTKHGGRYYLQYAFAGTEYNIYGDGVYVADTPLGPFALADNNPYSYKPGGFINGAGHGSTFQDRYGNWWHASSMGICVNYMYERRIGLWPAGFDQNGALFCNQRYGDWPMVYPAGTFDPWMEPEWMLLSYACKASASSAEPGHEPDRAVNETIKDWWRAKAEDALPSLCLDLGQSCQVNAIQINFADDGIQATPVAEDLLRGEGAQRRWISDGQHCTAWLLEGSLDGNRWETLCDKRKSRTNLPHDLVVVQEEISLRYVRLTVTDVPYGQQVAVSGLRVFGIAGREKPQTPMYTLHRVNGTDLLVTMQAEGAIGYQVLWGHGPDCLYHSYFTHESQVRIGALVAGRHYYFRVDAYNRCGITHGKVSYCE